MSQQTELENMNDFWRGAKAWSRFQPQWHTHVKRRLCRGRSKPRNAD